MQRQSRARATSPSTSRHSLFVSPDKDNSDIPSAADHYHHRLKASIEDALRHLLSEEMTLTKFDSRPADVFHCQIRTADHVILDAKYSIFRLQNIENLALQIGKDLATLNLDANELATRITRGLDNRNVLIPEKNPGFGVAVYIIGADPLLGAWQTAHRLNYNETQKAWRFTLPEGLTATQFKYMTGPYYPSKTVDPAHLVWEEGPNRELALSKTPTFRP